MTKKSSRIQTGASLPPDLLNRLRRSAKENGRTLSAEMELAVRHYLENQDASQLPPELIAAIEKWYKDNRIGNGSR